MMAAVQKLYHDGVANSGWSDASRNLAFVHYVFREAEDVVTGRGRERQVNGKDALLFSRFCERGEHCLYYVSARPASFVAPVSMLEQCIV